MSVTTIEWCNRPGTIPETLNPTTGCNKVNRGCRGCYAEIMHKRLQAMGQEKYEADFLDGAVEHPEVLDIPLTWKKPRTVFVNSMSDLFHKNVRFIFILQFLEVAEATPQHTYLVLTKRPDRAVEFQTWINDRVASIPEAYPHGWKWPPNVWMGTSCNDQPSLEAMVPPLLQLDCAIRFLSYEPATGPVNLKELEGHRCVINALRGVTDQPGSWYKHHKLDWVIAGGESGPKAVPAHPDWFRQVRDDCQAAGVPFFFKQWGNWRPFEFHVTDTIQTTADPDRVRFNGERCDLRTVYGPTEQVMMRTSSKSYNELDDRKWQQWPA